MKSRLFFFVFLLLAAVQLQAQPPTHVHWTHKAEHIQGDEYKLIFTGKIDAGWSTYSMFIEEGGPIATSVNIESGKYTEVGKVTESTSSSSNRKKGQDEMFGMELIKYKKDITLIKTVKASDNTVLEGYVEAMSCNDEQCTPPISYEFTFDLSKVVKKNTTNKGSTEEPEKKNEVKDENRAPDEQENKEEEVEETSDETTSNSDSPVKWQFSKEKVGKYEYLLTIRAEIADGWHIYSRTTEPGGPYPTMIEFDEATRDNIEIIDEGMEATADPANKKSGFEKLFDMELTKFKHDYVATITIKVKDPAKGAKGFITFQACDAEKCLPPNSDVEFTVVKPTKSDAPKGGGIIDGNLEDSIIKATFEKAPLCGEPDTSNLSLWMIFIFGFLGGFVALLTPCVFPMVPLTVSFFTKRSSTRAKGMRNALIYGLSIIVIYVTLGMLVTIIAGDEALNWISTHWIPNTAFFILFIAFAISFFGYYEITLPSSWSNKSDRAADRGGLLGIFFMAATLSLVSFSCTGPIIGTLLVQAAEGGRIAPAIGMLGFSTALALPFALFSAFPGWLNSLPKSGGWMNTVKVVLGFIEIALAFKFLSKADLTTHWGILKYETFMAIYVLTAIAMGIYLLGYIRFPHDDKNAKIKAPRIILALGSIALGAYFATGFMVSEKTGTYTTPNIMSGLAPPACYSYVYPCDCPAGIDQCFHDFWEGVAYAKDVKKPIMIDFTGYGCENCRRMEDNVWVKDRVNDLINDEYVLISLYVDDKAKLDSVMLSPDGTKLRTVGNKWAAFQRLNFKQFTQPQYVLMAYDGQTVLNKSKSYTPDAEVYADWLQCGLDNFQLWKKGELYGKED